MFLEHGYGQRFGVSDEELAKEVGGLRSREQLLEECDVVLMPKPLAADLAALRPGRVLWGWPHCVQDEELTQVAIDRHLTLIAWEAMNHWTPDGQLQPARVPQEQRARGLLLGSARARADRRDRRVRPAVERGGDQLRRDGSRRRGRAVRAWRPRRQCPHAPQRPGGRGADRAGAAGALRARSRASGPDARAARSTATGRSPSSSPNTTSSSIVCCRTPTTRRCS